MGVGFSLAAEGGYGGYVFIQLRGSIFWACAFASGVVPHACCIAFEFILVTLGPLRPPFCFPFKTIPMTLTLCSVGPSGLSSPPECSVSAHCQILVGFRQLGSPSSVDDPDLLWISSRCTFVFSTKVADCD